jgi:hypothetical protein
MQRPMFMQLFSTHNCAVRRETLMIDKAAAAKHCKTKSFWS